ncbi:MAG TPA: hypothetical protein ENJ83_02930 [Rhodospirillales bacterium]|nr:hypothetical protein [Rhodospirillales bacterium]
MSELRLVIGNRNTSSRSFAVWLVLRRAGLPFALEELDLRDPEGLEEAGRISPSGRLPVLAMGNTTVWEPLAICEYAAERCPELWPEAADARARARAIAAEAVYELSALLTFLPMDMTGRFTPPGRLLRSVERDLDRLRELWEGCLGGKASEEPFLFGRFSVADAFMAPIVSRLETYAIELGGVAEDYVRALSALPEYGEWAAAAAGTAPEAEGAETATASPATAPPLRAGTEATEASRAVSAPSPGAARPGARRLFGRRVPAVEGKEATGKASERPAASVETEKAPPPVGADAGGSGPVAGAPVSASEAAAAASAAEPEITPATPATPGGTAARGRKSSTPRPAAVAPAARAPVEEGEADAGAGRSVEPAPTGAGRMEERPGASGDASRTPPAKRPRPRPEGPIVKPIGGGIRRRR